MKAFLISALCVVACAGTISAQNLPPDYSWEVGFNVGYSNLIRPTGNAEGYQGTRTRHSTDKSLRLNYSLNEHWMLNLDIGDRHWETSGGWDLNSQLGQSSKPSTVKYVVADHAVNESVGISYVIPFYTRYNTFNRANLYFGVNVGLMQTSNDGAKGYGKYNMPDTNSIYVNRYDYGSGQGINLGFQMGYTWYIIPRLGINIDLGVRYAHIKTNDDQYGGENKSFYTVYFPETIGLRWRF